MQPELKRRELAILAAAMVCAPGTLRSEPKKGQTMEITIKPHADYVTLVNVFSVDPENQAKLSKVLKEGTEAFFSRQPGSISSSIILSKDGRKIINYSQWRSEADISAFREAAYFKAYIGEIMALAKADTMLCDVFYVHSS